MASIETAKNSLITAPSKVIGQLTNLALACEIWYDGRDVSGVRTTTAKVGYTTNYFVFTINGAADTRGAFHDTTGQLDCTSYTTMIAVAREINKVDGWHCRLLGVLGADSSNATIENVTAANCLKKAVQFPITSAAMETHAYCVSRAEGATGMSKGSTYADKVKAIYDEKGAVNVLFYLKVNPTYTGTNCTMTIYSVNGARELENLVGSVVLLATTVVNIFDFTEFPVTSRPGERLIVRIVADTNLAAITENLALGKSIQT